jgi:predicted Zn-dependent protease with MMP-like domain
MSKKQATRREIIMHFSAPPGYEDMQVLARNALDNLPEELLEFCEDIEIQVEDFPDEVIEQELDLEDPYDLLALYRSGRQIAPGVESRQADDNDYIMLFRRPILDLWCDAMQDLNELIRQVMIEEIGQYYNFTDDEIEEMSARHHQGLLP